LAKQFAAKNLNLNLKIDGIDLGTGMLDVTQRTGVYRSLETADLLKPLTSIQDQRYDVVICVGVLTQGHVRPGVLAEFQRVVKRGGFIIATVKEDIWESGGYEKAIEGLERGGKVLVVSTKTEDSLRGASVRAKLLLYDSLKNRLTRGSFLILVSLVLMHSKRGGKRFCCCEECSNKFKSLIPIKSTKLYSGHSS
jgi:ubiquinone/menaquinone biosynthesis C-methylase UbiE